MLLQKFRYNPMKFAGVNKKETCNLPLIRFKSSSTFAVDAFAWLCAFFARTVNEQTEGRSDRAAVEQTLRIENNIFFPSMQAFFSRLEKKQSCKVHHTAREFYWTIVSIIRFLLHITWSNVNNSHLTCVWRDTFSVDKATNAKSEIRRDPIDCPYENFCTVSHGKAH